MQIVKYISRVIIGLTFIFSGAVKAIDPLGSTYKFHDYFHAFNLGFLDKLSLPLAILLCTFEFIAGFSVLSGIKQKSGIWLAFLLMLFFTPLTLILALTNPVSDCGCFGDAVKLTNWQTFGKNVFLLIPVLILFAGRNKIKPFFSSGKEWIMLSSGIIVFVLFSVSNLILLPAIDFLPYKEGVRIAEKMVIPEGAPSDLYSTTFVYEKGGIRKEFSLSDYPANDTTWKFIDQKSVLIKKGYQPPIHDFRIATTDGEDITEKLLNAKGSSLLMVTKKLDEAAKKRLASGFELGKKVMDNGIDFFVLTASGSNEIQAYDNGLRFCSADETTLKTMVRANPGYILIRDGVIVGKWSWANVPAADWFASKRAENNPLGIIK
jgi:hypothetical protein